MPEQVNFLPDEILRARSLRRIVRRYLVATCVLLAVVVVAAETINLRNARADESMSTLREQVETMRALRAEVDPLAARIREAGDEYRAKSGFLEGFDWALGLGELSRAMNDNVWLTRCSLVLETDAEDAAISHSRMRVLGLAKSDPDLLDFMARLGSSDSMRGLQLEVSRLASAPNPVGVQEFEVAGNLN